MQSLTIYIQPEGYPISQHGTAMPQIFQATLVFTVYPCVLWFTDTSTCNYCCVGLLKIAWV